MKKIYLVIFVILVFSFVPYFSIFEWSSNEYTQYLPERDDGYEINDYNVNINVDEHRVLSITESITVNFKTASRGLIRYIPINQSIHYLDENNNVVTKNIKNNIYDFTVLSNTTSSSPYLLDKERSDGYMFYRMAYVSPFVGERTYSFSYKIDSGDDQDKSIDLLYYNIVGTGWDTSINNLDFSITFPTNIDNTNLRLYVGRYGNDTSGNDSRVTYSIVDNQIIGNCINLKYGEAVTVYKSFEEGYFSYNHNYTLDYIILGLFIGCIAGIILFYIVKRRKQPVVEVVEFKAPEGLTPTEVGFINDSKITGDDISSLIVYWASKGYVKLENKDSDVIINKVKDLPETAKKHEDILYKALFKNGDTISSKDLGTLEAGTGYKVKQEVEKSKWKYFDSKVENIFRTLIIISIAIFAFLLFRVFKQGIMTGVMLGISVLMFLLLTIALGFVPTIIKLKDKLRKNKFWALFAVDLVCLVVPMIVLMFVINPYADSFFARVYLSLLPALLLAIYPKLERYTEKGREVLGSIRGLKTYIQVAEKDRMEAVVNDNPQVFYDVLPFSYVLGVSDVYMEKFKDVSIDVPVENNGFGDFHTFTTLVILNNNMRVISTTMATKIVPPSTTNGSHGGGISGWGGGFGGSSGGGFSGGGAGGGGGGRF